MTLTDTAITGIKNHILSTLAYAQYRAGGKWTKIDIEKVYVMTDGRVAVTIFFDENAPDEITGIRLYDRSGSIWASGDVDINKTTYPEGIRYRLAIKITQEEIED